MEILVVLIIALVVFGPKRIPELGQSLGKGIREFKASLDGHDTEDAKGGESQQLPSSTEAIPTPVASTPPAEQQAPEART